MLGDTTFGQLAFVIVYIGFFELVATSGTNTYLVKTHRPRTDSVGRYVSNTIVMKVLMTSCASASRSGLAVVLGFSRSTMLLIGATASG